LWDEPPVSSSQGAGGTPTSGARFSVAKIVVPSNSPSNNDTAGNIRYMRIRFYGGSNTGNTAHYVNITSVYLGQVPPVIGPKYASTFIRDLSVDTLQIQNNAVTVPLSAQYTQDTTTFTNGVETSIPNTLRANFGVNIPGKVICLAYVDLNGSVFGTDWAAATIKLRWNSTNSTTLAGSTIVQSVQVNSRRGAPPNLSISTTIDGWSGDRYFFLTVTVLGETTVASGWWYREDANISLLGAKK